MNQKNSKVEFNFMSEATFGKISYSFLEVMFRDGWEYKFLYEDKVVVFFRCL